MTKPRNFDLSRNKTTTNFLSLKEEKKCFFLTSLLSESHLGFSPTSSVFRVTLYSYHYLYHYYMYISMTLFYSNMLSYHIISNLSHFFYTMKKKKKDKGGIFEKKKKKKKKKK